jgi:ribonuclease J
LLGKVLFVVPLIAVDHSIPAAYGFIIQTSEGPIIYTGDLKRHGPRKDLTENFIEKAKAAKPIALICEGTRMAEKETRQNYSEQQVQQISTSIVSLTDKAVFTMRASRDIDRFKSFYETEKKPTENSSYPQKPHTYSQNY